MCGLTLRLLPGESVGLRIRRGVHGRLDPSWSIEKGVVVVVVQTKERLPSSPVVGHVGGHDRHVAGASPELAVDESTFSGPAKLFAHGAGADEITVLLADDKTLIRQGIASLLQGWPGLRVVGEAVDGRDTLSKSRLLNPHIVLMEARMADLSGVELTRLICDEVPGASVLVLTDSEDDEDVFLSIAAGARGYILKNSDVQDLVAAIIRVAQGEFIISPCLIRRLYAQMADVYGKNHPKSGYLSLTRQERRVLQLIARGRSNREIAEDLVVAETTVKTHVRNVFEKLHVRSRVEAAGYAIRAGLCESGSVNSGLLSSLREASRTTSLAPEDTLPMSRAAKKAPGPARWATCSG